MLLLTATEALSRQTERDMAATVGRGGQLGEYTHTHTHNRLLLTPPGFCSVSPPARVSMMAPHEDVKVTNFC